MHPNRIQEAEGKLAERQTQHAAVVERRAKLERAVASQADDTARVRLEVGDTSRGVDLIKVLAQNARERIAKVRMGIDVEPVVNRP